MNAYEARREPCDAYLNFCLWLNRATSIDMFKFAEWVHANKFELSHGFQKSDESDPAVYVRMQYSRAMGLGS